MNSKSSEKIIVAMSGGVDSSVAALLLCEQGYDVIGATLDFGFGNAVDQAAKVCFELGIEHKIIDAKEALHNKVIEPFVASYFQGRTPNPCVDCNATVKFPLFFPLIEELGVDQLATGHYVRLIEQNGRYLLQRAVFKEKDQSYFMYRIPQSILKHCLFPLWDFTKEEVRAMAKKNNLSSAMQKDSCDICFIHNGDYRQCITKFDDGKNRSGDIVDKQANVLGQHQGLANYTIGQRRGLKLAMGYPAYVIALDSKLNQLVIGKKEDLFSDEAIVSQLAFLPFDVLKEKIEAKVQIRYAAKPVPAIIEPMAEDKTKAKIIFTKSVWAVTPGQSAVFYDDDILIGGGYIV